MLIMLQMPHPRPAHALTQLGGQIIAEGVETKEEYFWLRSQGINLYQGYLFAKPGFECLPEPVFPA